ncbi:dynein heavy chain domain-containing protein 1 [Cheilinus undulatus]|uniref:dynein heavy chain domain-containing protein 1 n=1 Tax=Cheilinus undulatus TaxID=241271 RepID=UPI001BD52EE3|nr:dynein heavy chain domain-containing protein 1 [Cheilinus undulatus]
MFGAPSQKQHPAGASQGCVKGIRSKMQERGLLPPLYSMQPLVSAARPATRPLLDSVPSKESLFGVELPRLKAQVGPRRASDNTKRTEGPGLGTSIPARTADGSAAHGLTGKDESIKVTACNNKRINTVRDGRGTELNKGPLTAIDVLHIFAKKRDHIIAKKRDLIPAKQRDLGESELYYLKEVDGDSYRPYDLQVVPFSEVGSEYYVFSSNSVLHVTKRGYGETVSLADWHRESVLWTALQEIPFFQKYRLHKAFKWWHTIVRRTIFRRRADSLQDKLVILVPQLRNVLFMFKRVIEELKETHLLHQEETKTYRLLDFQHALKAMHEDGLETLKKLSQCRSFILNKMREDCYKSQQQLQLHLKYAEKPNKRSEPIHLHQAHQQDLKDELAESESVFKKLGNFAALINQMTMQTLVTITKQDATAFLNNVVKRQKSKQGSVFDIQLCFDANNSLTVEPSIQEYQRAVSEALLSVGETVIQICDDCGFFLEVNNSISSSDFAQEFASDLSVCECSAFTESRTKSDCKKFCCQRYLRDLPSTWPIQLEETVPMAQGNRMHGCYYPLIRSQLEWQMSINDMTKKLEKEQEKIMQEAELEILQLCKSYSWLQDIHLFTSQWSRTSWESMKGPLSLLFEELVKTLHHWTEKIHTVPSYVSTSNNLFIIDCTRMKENLGKQLRSVEDEIQKGLVEQIEHRSENLVSDLERAAAALKTEPRDLNDLSEYAPQVREATKMLADVQKRLEYIHSLQDTLCMNYRKMTEQEVTLEKKVLATWDCFVSVVKQADNIVCKQLPSMSHALDTMFSCLVCDLKNTVTKATSGPFLDPTQNAKETVTTLKHMCKHVHILVSKLENISRTSQNLREHPMDMSMLTADIKKIEARKELWELAASCKTWLEQWKQLPFSEVVVSKAQEKIVQWKDKALSLSSVIPTNDAVLLETVAFLESLSPQLATMALLQSTTLKQKDWKSILTGMGLLYDPERRVMVAELMSEQHEVDQKLITKICSAAQAESNMKQTFLKLQQRWEGRLFQMDRCSLPSLQQCEPHHDLTEKEKPTDSMDLCESASLQSCKNVRLTIKGLDLHSAEIDNDMMTLSTMVKSPHAVDFKQQMEEWMQSLQELGTLLDLFKRYQQKWAFLTKMFHETSCHLKRVDLLDQFQPVDTTFKEMMFSLSVDPHILNLVNPKMENERFHAKSLCKVLLDGLSIMDAICHQLTDQLDTILVQFPRLCFLSDREKIELLLSNQTPMTLQPFVRKCFTGVCLLEVECEEASNAQLVKTHGTTTEGHRQMNVLGIFGSLQEHISFLSPLEPNVNALAWLSDFDKQLKLAMVHLLRRCASMHRQLEPCSQDLVDDDRKKIVLPELDVLSEHPLQCLLVSEEAAWCTAVRQAFKESSPAKLNSIKAYTSEKLENLGSFIRDGITRSKREPLVSKYMMVCLRALVQLTMNNAQQLSKLMEVQHVPLESSFEWLSLMKYTIPEDTCLKSNTDPTCFIDVLGHQLHYDYEYFGPGDWEMVQTQSTDRASLGILLALTSYRCGFVNGPSMAGKKTTVVQLGKALGQQIVNIQCGSNMRSAAILWLLLGALQAGAWLLLDSVDLLTQEALSILGQHLENIHRSFSMSTGNENQRMKEETKDRTADCKNTLDSECHMVLAGKSISARLNYGCILISSKGYPSEVPQSLRCAARPIALTHPDYRIIAEVMLTSIGFSEAMSLSHQLVSLISLAKDSNCLPDFITDTQSFYLVLQRIISASERHLKQSVRQHEISKQARGLAAEQPDLTFSQNSLGNVKKKRGERKMPSQLPSSHLSVILGLMEETAVVKAILSIILPSIHEQKKASQFHVIFKEIFPIVSQFPFFQQHIEEEEKSHLKDAITEELQSQGLQSDTENMCTALTLHHTIKFSQAVLLLGPSGSGKTTCYSTLAGALNLLAFNARVESEILIQGDTPQVQPEAVALTWSSVDTVVLFPNAMSHEELFGFFCDKRGWQDGAFSKVLRDSEQSEQTTTISKNKSGQPPRMKWLVMDGEPLGQPGWLDYLATLCSPKDPFLCLPSCETLRPESHLKLLIETNNLGDASPSAVTCCSLVYFPGTDLWKAVWKSEIDALSFEHKLDQKVMNLWNHLAEDLFLNTLSFLRKNALTSAIHSKEECSKSLVDGLQEVMSFVRVIRALLKYFGMEVGKAEAFLQIDKRDTSLHRTSTDGPTKQDFLARNLFLVAYIWGFSGHLHPRHWPQFDLLARQLLFSCRYKIVVPDAESVFEHFFNKESRICPKNSLITTVISPKYGKYMFLLNLMFEANQPVLLAGEVGSGKSTLCKTLLTFDKPHICLRASQLLSFRDIRTLVENIRYKKNPEDSKGFMTKQPRLLLFVDDLHEAPCDVFGKTSTALETLRQSISKGEILTYSAYHFKLLCSRCISYIATCCVFGSGIHQSYVISSRLSRLFSIFVLPCLSVDVIFSLHSSRLKSWLKEMPLKQSCEQMAYCIITATKNLYDTACEQFQPTAQRPHFTFSHHDIQKVFSGMCLWQPKHNSPNTTTENGNSPQGFPSVLPGSAPASLNIAQLWMHECMRTFGDRLSSEDECRTLVSLISKTATTHYGLCLIKEAQPANSDDPGTIKSLSVQSPAADTEGTNRPTCQTVETINTFNLSQEPIPADQAYLEKSLTQTEPTHLSEDNRSEQERLKTHPLQPQILQYMEDKVTKLVYGPELTETLKSANCNPSFCCFYQDLELDIIQQELCAFIDRNEKENRQIIVNGFNVTTRNILHRQRVKQLLRILRVLLIPGGHGLLIASERATGRKTNVRLAAHLLGYQLMEVHPGNENKLHEIVKEAGNQTRMEGTNVIILAHEGLSQSVRDELLVAMANRTYPGLYTNEELAILVSRVTEVKNSRRYAMDNWTLEKFLGQIHRNVHVFLLLPFTMPESNKTHATKGIHGWNAQLTKALSCSCCVEVYQPWSIQSLVEIASQRLEFCLHKRETERPEASLSVAMAGIHQSACQYASVHLTAQPFSPQTYMEFIAHFSDLYRQMHMKQQSQANRVATALTRLDVIRHAAAEYKEDVDRLQKRVAEAQRCEKELLSAKDYQRSRLEEAQKTCAEEEGKLCNMEEMVNYAHKQMNPVLLSGLKILKCLNPSDLEEVRHYRDPPDGVVKIMDAICVLFKRPPGWESAKQLLGQPNFFQELEFFDRYSLTNKQLQQLSQIVKSSQFVPESVREVSKACESLCQWVKAVYECCCLQHQLLVKQHLKGEAHQRLRRAMQDKTDACHRLENIKHQLLSVKNLREELMLELHTTEQSEKEAATAAALVETHNRDWRAAAQETELNDQTLLGDALTLAAVISYLGPFGPDTRTELLSKWRELCQTGRVEMNPKDLRTSLFAHSDTEKSHPLPGFPITLSESLWLPAGRALGRSQDAPTNRIVVKLLLWGCRRAWVQRWPLLVDAQQHPDVSPQSLLKPGKKTNLEKETECGLVLRADDPELLDKLDQAAVEGLRVIVTHIERGIPSPRFLARLTRSAGSVSQESEHHIHPEFFLFLTTNLPVNMLNDEIHPSILALVGVVDLSLSSEEIQERMLTQLLQSECNELLSQHVHFQNDKQLLQEKLVSEEEALMNYIQQSHTSLLQDPDFPRRVTAYQELIKNLHAEIQQLSGVLEFHKSLLAVPQQFMRLAADLYQDLQGVSRLSPTYYFPLHSFIKVMQEAIIVKGKPLVPYAIRKMPKEAIPEVTNRMVTQLFLKYRPLLFKSHFAVLKLLVSVTLLKHYQLCSEAERRAFIRGFQDRHLFANMKPCLPPPSLSPSTSALPSWIPPHVLPELFCLEKMPGFEGLIASLSRCAVQWQEYLRFPSSTVVGAVPCRSHSHLSVIQRALLWKTMNPDCLEGLAKAMAAYHRFPPALTGGIEDPHIGNPEALLQVLAKHEGPIILTLPGPSGDKWTSTQPLHFINTLAQCVAETKKVLVKVIPFGSLCDREIILSMLDGAVSDGHWLVFNNCHLLKQWDDKVVAHLRCLTALREQQNLIHPCFQLWFITQEYASCSIPAAVRMFALPLVCDSAWDLKDELSCSFREAVSIMQSKSLWDMTADNKELLLRCAIFHSVLLQRQSYKYLGQGRIYSWSHRDLLALMDEYLSVASRCHDRNKALNYIAVNLVHGGHVLDSADLEVLESVAETCFGTSPSSGSGPHVIADVIIKPGSFDLSALHQVLRKNSADINDAFMLGFSGEIAAEMIKINSQRLNIQLQASHIPVGTTCSFCSQLNQFASLPAYSQAKDRLQALKTYLTHKKDSLDSNAGVVSPSPLCDFLQAEWDDLIDSVSFLLSQLQQPVQYSTLTFSSLLEYADMSRLERRAELLSAYLFHLDTPDPPGAYRLSAFKNARGFLAAVMRKAARVNRKNIGDISLNFQVLGDSTYPASLLDSVYLCGLELRGAVWDSQLRALQDTVSSQPSSLPLLCAKTQVMSSKTFQKIYFCNSSLKRDAQVTQTSAACGPQLPFYHCPLYLDRDQARGNQGLADVNIVTMVPLHAKLNPVLCNLRRVRLVSML